MAAKVDMPPIIIDTREQKPFEFVNIAYVVDTLKTGDYSLVGLKDRVAIERKSKEDAYNCIAGGRVRFEKQVQRLSRLEYGAIVIECSMKDFHKYPPKHSRLDPKSAMQTLMAWSVKYDVPVHFCDDVDYARGTTVALLRHFYRYNVVGVSSKGGKGGGKKGKENSDG